MRKIKYLVMDVDGTLTDGKIYLSSSGEMMKVFNIKDGYGLCDILNLFDIIPIVITGRQSDITLARCKELGIRQVYQGVVNKVQKLMTLVDELSTVAYIGDDKNDIPSMVAVKNADGIVGCPLDAVIEVKVISDFVAPHKAGDGAVRDFIEWFTSL